MKNDEMIRYVEENREYMLRLADRLEFACYRKKPFGAMRDAAIFLRRLVALRSTDVALTEVNSSLEIKNVVDAS